MTINPVVRKQSHTSKTTPNSEGYGLYSDRPDRALALVAASFRHKRGFYRTPDQMLATLGGLVDGAAAKDREFVYALAWYLGKKLGIRLSPTLMLARMEAVLPKKTGAKGDAESCDAVVREVFTRPDFIANAMAYFKRETGESIAHVPKGFRRAMRRALESYPELKLKRRRMRRLGVTLADLVKVLRPKPGSEKMSALYRAIIENRPEASLKVVKDEKTGKVVKAEHVTAVLSDKTVSAEAKREHVKESVSTMPLNALIRNLGQMKDITPEEAETVRRRLDGAFASGDAARFANPFDLIFLEGEYSGYSMPDGVSPLVADLADRVLVERVMPGMAFDFKRPVILLDTSGSMYPWYGGKDCGLRTAAKFLGLMLPTMKGLDWRPYCFSGRLHRGWQALRNELDLSGPNRCARSLLKYCEDKHETLSGGTSLLECTKAVIKAEPEMDSLIILTDEQTWKENLAVQAYRNIIPSRLDGRVLLINVSPQGLTAFKPNRKVMRVSGLHAGTLALARALFDFDGFKAQVKAEFAQARTRRE